MRRQKVCYSWSLMWLWLVFVSCKGSDTKPPVITPDTTTTAYGTPFAKVPDTKDIVMYEVNMRAFSSTGNFKGVQDRLDSIKALGVNVIWLMPIHPVGILRSAGGMGSPYSVRNYKEVNSEFGNLDDLRKLVEQAHARDMAVIIDWVADHTSWDHSWITAHKDWYKQDNAGNIIIPPNTNWQDVAALNFTNSLMRLEMISSMQYWILQANIDGFRCDAADLVPDDFWKQAISVFANMSNRKLILLAEGTKKEHFSSGFQLTYGWEFNTSLQDVYEKQSPVSLLVSTHTNEYSGMPATTARLRYTTNHDLTAYEDTPLGMFGGQKGSLSAFVLAAYMGGSPLLYNGQEVGCTVRIPLFDRSTIDWTTNAAMVTEYKRVIGFRKNSKAVKEGTLNSFSSSDIAAFTRTAGQEKVLVLVNVRNATVKYTVPADLKTVAWKDAFTNASVTLADELMLEPYGYQILHML